MIELIILVDYENVQPAAEDLADLEVGKHLLKVFHGPGQNSMPIKLATTLMPVGAAVEFIQCEKAGKDALDFHLSFHFGRLSVQHPQAQYVIVSRDRKGFSQLIEHGGKLGIKVTLVPSLRDEDMNDDGTPVVRTESPARAPREPRETREPRAPRSRTGSKSGRAAAAPAAQGQQRRGGRDAARDGGRRDDPQRPSSSPSSRTDTRPAPAVQAPAPTPAPIAPPQVDDDTRDAVEALMADIVASDGDDVVAPAPAPAPEPAPAPAAKKAPARKAAAKKSAANTAASKTAAAKKAPAKKAAAQVVEAVAEPVVEAPAPAPAKKAARKTSAKTATKTVKAAEVVAAPEVAVPVAAPVATPVAAPVAAPVTTSAPAKKAARKSPARKTVDAPAPVEAVAPAPAPKPAPSTRQLRDEPMPSDTRKALDSLKRLGDGKRPVKVASLRSHLRSHLRADLSEAGVEALLDQMRAQGWISELDHGKVGYQLP